MNFWLKLRVWFKVTVFVAVALYLLLFVFNNTGDGKDVALWVWFGKSPTLPVLAFIPLAFMAGVVTTLLIRTILRTIAQLRDMKRRHIEREAAAVVARAAKIRVREQQLKNHGRGFDVVESKPDEPAA